MSQVEQVALWIGLLTGVVSTVLAVVAIVFTILVNRRSDTVSAATVQALTVIQADVRGLGNDVRELIKDAWLTMLHERGSQVSAQRDALEPEELAQGLAAEVRSDLAGAGGQVTQQVQEALDQLASRISQQMAAVATGLPGTLSMPERMKRIVEDLEGLSPEALHLLRRVSRGMHLTRPQYLKLMNSNIQQAVRELRRNALLLPYRTEQTGEPVYWIPGSIPDLIELGAKLVPDPPAQAAENVDNVLRAVGYEVTVDDVAPPDPKP